MGCTVSPEAKSAPDCKFAYSPSGNAKGPTFQERCDEVQNCTVQLAGGDQYLDGADPRSLKQHAIHGRVAARPLNKRCHSLHGDDKGVPGCIPGVSVRVLLPCGASARRQQCMHPDVHAAACFHGLAWLHWGAVEDRRRTYLWKHAPGCVLPVVGMQHKPAWQMHTGLPVSNIALVDCPWQNEHTHSMLWSGQRHTLNAEMHDAGHRKPARDQAVAQLQVPVSTCAVLCSSDMPSPACHSCLPPVIRKHASNQMHSPVMNHVNAKNAPQTPKNQLSTS